MTIEQLAMMTATWGLSLCAGIVVGVIIGLAALWVSGFFKRGHK